MGRTIALRRIAFALAAVVAVAGLCAAPTVAETLRFFRIGTGATGGTYFPIGAVIANAISNPPGSRPCDRGGSCGVPGLVAVAQSTQGSVENVDAIGAGRLESGFSQADVAYWAYRGSGIYRRKGAVKKLRVIANLYPESVHLVVRRDAGIKRVADLRGKRVSLGERGSGTLVDATIILAAHGLSLRRIKASRLRLGIASDRLRAGRLDAFFFVAGFPAPAISDLSAHVDIAFVEIAGRVAGRLRKKYPFFGAGVIPADAYPGVAPVETLTVGAQWVVSADVDEALVYAITRALWHKSTRRLLLRGHAEGGKIRLATALDGIGIPLHPGAERYYREIGRLK